MRFAWKFGFRDRRTTARKLYEEQPPVHSAQLTPSNESIGDGSDPLNLDDDFARQLEPFLGSGPRRPGPPHCSASGPLRIHDSSQFGLVCSASSRLLDVQPSGNRNRQAQGEPNSNGLPEGDRISAPSKPNSGSSHRPAFSKFASATPASKRAWRSSAL